VSIKQSEIMTPNSSTHAKSDKRGQAWRLLLGSAVSLALLWLAFRGVDWAEAWGTLRRADGLLLLASLGSVLLTTGLRATRWRLMFYPHHHHLRLRRFVGTFFVGQVVNAVIPARVGEVARAYLIGESEGVSKMHALWTAVVEKVLDALVLLVFIMALSLAVQLPFWLQRAAWLLSGGILVGMIAMALALASEPRVASWIAAQEAQHGWIRRLRLRRLLKVVAQSVRLLRQPTLSIGLLGWSLLAFFSGALTNWLVARALGLPLPYRAALLLLAVLQISAVVPIPTSPGRIGLFHYLCVITLAIFGVERDIALGYGLVLHVIFYLPMTIGGPLALWLQSYRWHDVSRLLGRRDLS
jgi:hypothetical protein